ncbi:BTAD domain-containing putative transcriptional regulator [Streptomyces xiangluensis]|uniref:BTAD domain-containing putative transcriptional regulator n=1 Tax=Streptomyces xiangluensis TaxID=2665720 RepID=A0ABV8Z5K5_9ACTN
MLYGILGPVQVLCDDTPVDLGPRQRRVLLTRLLIEDGRPVSLGELCRDLWEGDQPQGAVSSVRAHISRLRSVLDPVRQGRSPVLVNGPGGYALTVPREARDTVLFDQSVARAREAMRRGQLLVARDELDAGLRLWRGEALGEAAEHAFAARETTRLNAAHQDARELQAAILIKLGDVERAISIAESLTISAPLREDVWALLMRALYGAGRSVEALQQYESFRAMLAKDLGLDPSPGLRDLHTAILRHDTGVLGDHRPSRYTASVFAGPGDTSEPLVGRAEEIARMATVLQTAAAGRTQWAVLSGEPGAGKTRLLDEMSAQAEAAGFTVTRASGGQALSESQGITLVCPTTQLLDGLRQASDAAPTRDGADGVDEGPLAVLLRELGRGPVLCVIDDLDWSPPEFHALLRELAAVLRDAPVAVVCALRNADDPVVGGLLADLARHGATWLHLEPLSVADVAELLTARGESASLGEAAALHRRGEGNPFVLGELLKLPPDRRTGPAARVPISMHSIIQARLAEQPNEVRALLTYAAADGESLDIDLLADVQGMARERLLPLIDVAVTARILVWDADPDERTTGRYRFPELHREVVLSALTPSSRQLLHAALARELTHWEGAEPARLARHLRAAGPMAPTAARGH